MSTSSQPVSREQLYDMVWQEPMLKIGERFGVSSSYMARVCTELRVPRPERGYWAKLEGGKAPMRPALPQAAAGDVTQWSPGANVGTTQRTVVKRQRERISSAPEGKAQSDARHELVVGVRHHFLKTRDNDSGFLRPFKKMLLDVISSERHLDATLAHADALFKALTKRGHRVMLATSNSWMQRGEIDQREVSRANHYVRSTWSPDRSTLVYLDGVPIGLTMFEMSEAVEMMYVGNSKYVPVRDLTAEQLRRFKEPHYWKTTDDLPSGRIALKAYSTFGRVKWSKRWQETKADHFSTMVPEIVRELEVAAPDLAAKQQHAEKLAEEERLKWIEEQRLAEIEAERQRRQKAAQDARQDLLKAIASWEQARSVHEYFDLVEGEIDGLPEAERAQVLGRLQEARSLIGPVDALAQLKQWKAPQER